MNSAGNLTDDLLALIAKEEARVEASFGLVIKGNRSRLALLQLIRALDHFHVTIIDNHLIEEDLRSMVRERYRIGWARAARLFLNEEVEDDGAPLFCSNETLQLWAESVVNVCSGISLLQMVLDWQRTGLCDLKKGDDNRVNVQLKTKWIGLESIERRNFDWVKGFIVKIDSPQWDRLNQERPIIREEMKKEVRIWPEHFMSYEASSRTEEHYHKTGLLFARLMVGQDSFADDALFGGLPFDLYRSVAAVLVGWALQHAEYAGALLNQYAELNIFDLLTTTYSERDLAQQLCENLEIDISDAHQALKTLVLGRDNRDYHCSQIAGANPPLIQAGQNWVYRSCGGCMDAPFMFLLRELKRLYPDDYFRAVNGREARFRQELYDLFPLPNIIKSHAGVKLRQNRKIVTDIDAAIYSQKSRVLGLFQLKWHDPFGSSMLDRRNRRTNFEPVAARWVRATSEWLSSNELGPILSSMGLHSGNTPVERIHLFVIGRHFASFSGDEVPDERAAYGLWPQLLRLILVGVKDETFDLTDPLTYLYERLQEDSPFRVERPKIVMESFHVGETEIVFHSTETKSS